MLAAQGLAQTQAGHRAPDQAPAPLPQPSTAFKGTMLGIAPLGAAGGPPEVASSGASGAGNVGAPPAGPAGATTQNLRGTMIGIAPIAPAAPPPAPLPTQTISMSAPVPKGTLLGLPPVDPRSQEPFAGVAPVLATPGGEVLGSKRTIMGVARPGIAPINPGSSKPAEPVPPAWAPLPSPPPPPPEGTPGDELSVPPRSKGRIPLLAALVIVAAAALFTAAGVVLLLHRARGEIQTSVTLSKDGHEELVLTCQGCDDGATARYGSASGTFRARRATLRLARELAVGDNKLTIELERRRGKPEPVELVVPVEFRVRGDTSDLVKMPPNIKIVAKAVKGSAVVIDGKAVPLADDGTASLTVDVSRALTGPDAVQRTLEHRVPYAVTPPDGSPKRGEVVVRVGITPLVLQAPGDSITIETPTFVLAGRTAKNGVVSVEGRPITVDATGQFAQVMGVSAEGETTVIVRAVAPDQAPRLIPIRVRRVASLAAEAERVRPQATTSYAAIAAPSETQRGLLVLLDGVVVESRAENFATVFLMEVKEGCASAPCLLRVTFGSKVQFTDGDAARVFGTLSGAVNGPRAGTRIPSVAASFVVKGRL